MRRLLAMVVLGAAAALTPAAAMADENGHSSPFTGTTSSAAVEIGSGSGAGAQQLGPSDGAPADQQTPVYLQNNQ